ncbi:unnamed protein product [Gongylonema pulchrum]|uniref:Mitochondrial inner membrane protein OXA1L n=1 Tax=Gongylonema pulchrum TaxID=637853 RepID=A0A183ELF1_9BILA|nr:unnamed protein product [Gongylonema pulchrum]
MGAKELVLTPLIMNALEKYPWFTRRAKFLNVPTQLLFTFVLYSSMIPVGCALYPQMNNVTVGTLKRYEPSAYEEMRRKMHTVPTAQQLVFFNKGL